MCVCVCVCETHQTHAYHIVNLSPWPLSVRLITSGLVILFHFNSTTPFLLGLLTNTLTIYQWWWDIQESAFQCHYTPTVQKGLCCGIFFFKSSQRSYFLPSSFELFIIQVSLQHLSWVEADLLQAFVLSILRSPALEYLCTTSL